MVFEKNVTTGESVLLGSMNDFFKRIAMELRAEQWRWRLYKKPEVKASWKKISKNWNISGKDIIIFRTPETRAIVNENGETDFVYEIKKEEKIRPTMFVDDKGRILNPSDYKSEIMAEYRRMENEDAPINYSFLYRDHPAKKKNSRTRKVIYKRVFRHIHMESNADSGFSRIVSRSWKDQTKSRHSWEKHKKPAKYHSLDEIQTWSEYLENDPLYQYLEEVEALGYEGLLLKKQREANKEKKRREEAERERERRECEFRKVEQEMLAMYA